MYYGNLSAVEPISSDASYYKNVWTNGYTGVYHLNNNGGTLNVNDSTSNSYNGTNNGATVTADGIFAGAGAGSFNGISNYINLSTFGGLGNAFTVSAWVNMPVNALANSVYGEFNTTTGDSKNSLAINGTTEMLVFDQFQPSGGGAVTTLTTPRGWYYVTGAQSATNNRILYVNGIQKATATEVYSGSAPNARYIGARRWGAQYYFGGSMSEVRLSSVARSVGWISTEYNNQSSPATFYSIGNQETQ
jgi:hypothetical protein